MSDLKQMLSDLTMEQKSSIRRCKTTSDILEVMNEAKVELAISDAEDLLEILDLPDKSLSEKELETVSRGNGNIVIVDDPRRGMDYSGIKEWWDSLWH